MSRNPLSRLARAPFIVRALLTFVIMLAIAAVVDHVHAPHVAALSAAAPLLLGPIRQVGKTYQNLIAASKPPTTDQPESIPHVMFDTQQYPAAGVASLSFFSSATAANASDPTLSNFATGSLDQNYFFEIHRIHVIFQTVPANATAVGVTGPANDLFILHHTARGVFGLRQKGKQYGDYPLHYFGRPGGPIVSYVGTWTAADYLSVGQNDANGGFPVLGNVIVTPTTKIGGVMTFNSTAISVATNITVGLMGVLHRPIA